MFKSSTTNFSHTPYTTTFVVLLSLIAFSIEAWVYFSLHGTLGNVQVNGKPYNFWLFPDAQVLVHSGARATFCMRPIELAHQNIGNATLSQACGLSMAETGYSLQWLRFIISNFLHFGLLHLFPNLMVLSYLGYKLEFHYGWRTTAGVSVISGIAGNVMGGYFSKVFEASAGTSTISCSLLGATIVDILFRWRGIKARKIHISTTILITVLVIFNSFSALADGFSNFSGFVFGVLSMSFALIDSSYQVKLSKMSLSLEEYTVWEKKKEESLNRRLVKVLLGLLMFSLFLTFLLLFYLSTQ